MNKAERYIDFGMSERRAGEVYGDLISFCELPRFVKDNKTFNNNQREKINRLFAWCKTMASIKTGERVEEERKHIVSWVVCLESWRLTNKSFAGGWRRKSRREAPAECSRAPLKSACLSVDSNWVEVEKRRGIMRYESYCLQCSTDTTWYCW